MIYTAAHIASVMAPHTLLPQPEAVIDHLLTDSRKLVQPATTLFFALPGIHRHGNQFIQQLYTYGVRHFVVDDQAASPDLPEAVFFKVPDVLRALQTLATYHRSRFMIPVIGITGSNGKTIVKEWLYQMLQSDYNVVRSPKSYNSQVGVPLSVWQMNPAHSLAIFEAGISKEGEMAALAAIIQPTIGVLTSMGEAHAEGFSSSEKKLEEKQKLFETVSIVIGPSQWLKDVPQQVFTWGSDREATLQILHKKITSHTEVTCLYGGAPLLISVPFADEASIENALTCCCIMLHLGYEVAAINQKLATLHPIDMRLQLKHGSGGAVLINDSYSADLTSLQLALNFFSQQKGNGKRTVILSDFVESGKSADALYGAIGEALLQHRVDKVVAIGKKSSSCLPSILNNKIELLTFPSTESFLRELSTVDYFGDIILVKGARRFGFERIVQALETRVHQTVLEINLNALAHNLKQYQSVLKPGTKTMAMVKAFSYGSGSSEIAATLQFHGVDYLGVAYADEGIALRHGGIHVPIMVMNADEAGFPALIENGLQPVLYSFSIMQQFEAYVSAQGLRLYPVHIELETGMNRLGFAPAEIEQLATALKDSEWLKVQSVFTHLVASEDPAQDDFTFAQASLFQASVQQLEAVLNYRFIKHIANSAAILRHPQLHLDMVRLGIGLYGVEIATARLQLQAVATLRSTIAQLKYLHAGDTVSYNRKGVIKEDTLIATVRIGYADGYSRRLGNGVGKMSVNGRLAPVVGAVCMDMTMLDITKIQGVKEGDEVIIFGDDLSVEQLAEWCGTIPYEIMTGISQRVKRVYFQE